MRVCGCVCVFIHGYGIVATRPRGLGECSYRWDQLRRAVNLFLWPEAPLNLVRFDALSAAPQLFVVRREVKMILKGTS